MMTRARALTLTAVLVTAGCAALTCAFWTGLLRPGDARVIAAAALLGAGLFLIAFMMLRRRAAELREARDKAEENSRAKSHFLATMSHEIRTPMNGVLGMARLLLETPLAPDQKTYAEAIRQSGLSLLALIEDILDFSKIESGALTLDYSDVALRPLVEGVAELLATRAHAKGIEIATAIDADVPNQIRTDAMRLRQVLTNLIGNAVKFTQAGGVLVTASLERDTNGATLVLSVSDTGIGVPPEKAQAIFEDFVQADSSHARRFEGTGLGLAISKRLMTAMAGDIGVRPREGHGSVFWVKLPLREIQSRSAPAPLRNKRVALLDVAPIVAAGLKRQIAAAGGVCAELGAIDALAADKHDLILIDVGAEGPRDMRGLDMPAIALLSATQRTQLAILGDRGIRGYLVKPVRQDSLEKRVLAVLAGDTELAPAPVAVKPAYEPHVGGELSVLLAEDNPVNALLARELLKRRGHRVELVITGDAAVEACAARRFDVVLMDLHMPGCDGIEATVRIRSAEADADVKPVPIFALTADAVETGRKACLEAGMDGFLTKPIDPADLDAVLATIHPEAVLAAE
jgi:signal transduction histidine kinase/CheY-like chemotaxis protein